ncbi:sensor histidine kinase [Actinoplanes sp. NPDC051470]|uniref:sensor histidine kinase n=1 Tax=unclassified Actinoplanes TaxID=2626549 RepID=UPI0034374A95
MGRPRSRRHAPWQQDQPWPDPPWRSNRPHKGPPAGVAIGAGLFHVLGAKDIASDGLVYHPFDVLVYALLLIGPIALIWRRRAPVAVLLIAMAASIGFATMAAPRWVFLVAPLIACWNAVKQGKGRPAFLASAAGYVAYVLVAVVLADELGLAPGTRPGLRTLVVLAAALLLSMFFGGAAKAQSEHRAEVMKARAERARAKEEQERRQASEERLRMARELHDVLGHHLSLISVQAGVGLHLMDNQPEQAREALTAIKTASGEALREVRAVLGVLRPEEEAAPRQPALGLDRLDELTGSAGLPVTTTRTGLPRPLPAEVDRAAYRIVQEALTNVRKHAGPAASAEVSVDYAPEGLRLSIRNDGSPASSNEDGSGITGMRERASALGGSLQAGPLPAGGFLVTVLLPVPPDPAPDSGGPAPQEAT